jgi:hypothetical protein
MLRAALTAAASWLDVETINYIWVANNKIIPMGNTQKLMLFIRGNAMSGLPTITGTYQFPNPPINVAAYMASKRTQNTICLSAAGPCMPHSKQPSG